MNELNYNAEVSELFSHLKTTEKGLTASQAINRLEKFGANIIEQKKRTNYFIAFFLSFASPLTLALLIIAGFSFIFGEQMSAYFIIAMAFLGSMLSFIQETKAEISIEKLLNMVKVKIKVLRDGEIREIYLQDIVPGDVVYLATGNIIPADLRIIESKHLFVNQSSLTGESIPVEKSECAQAGICDKLQLKNIAFMGSSVVSGNGVGLVIKTGKETEFGKLSKELASKSPKTSFDQGVERFTWLMLRLIIIMSLVIFVINVFVKGNIVDSLLFSLAVAVGLVPEMLPVMINLNLSKGALNMAKKQVIVKNLNSIQNFGAMDILCTDKTGTLTTDQITLIKYCDFRGEEDKNILKLAHLNSYHQTGLNNIFDQAVLNACNDKVAKEDKIDEIPYDNARRMLSIVEKSEGYNRLITKGSPEEVLKRCKSYEIESAIHELTPTGRLNLNKKFKELSQDGLIVLALAYRKISKMQDDFTEEDERDLVFKGFIGFLDPPKPSAQIAIEKMRGLGINLKILSGDNELVVKKICSEFRIPTERILSGDQVEKATDEQLLNLLDDISVFARLTPLQKERVVKALQKQNHVVGFLGDGINDAPALKIADVGISVNNAADVAKDTADIVLLKKDLTVLEDCVTDGRRTFRNITKYIKMGASSNFGNMFSVVGASIFLPFLPMLPIQILFNNLLYDFSQITIPTDNVDDDSLQKPTPWNINLVQKFMFIMGPISSIFDFLTFGLLFLIFKTSPEAFHTGWFIESILTQTLIIHIIRTKKIPFLESKPSGLLLFSSLIVVAVGIAITFTDFGKILGFTALPISIISSIIGITILYLFATQLVKNWFAKKYGYD